MPSKSQSQHDLMNIAAHDEAFAKKNHIPQEVAQDFIDADKKEGLWQPENKESSKDDK